MSVLDNEAAVKLLLGIPAYEPIFILRGQDKLALGAIEEYEESAFEARANHVMSSTIEWKGNMINVLHRFRNFKKAYPDRMKYPD